MRNSTAEATTDPNLQTATGLRMRWSKAIVSVIRLEREYSDLVSHREPEDKAVDGAWLRLWHAQEEERLLASELDRFCE